VGIRRVFILLILLICLSAISVHAQSAPPSEKLALTAKSAATWTNDHTNVITLHGPVKIELDRATLSADDAVIWLKPASADNLEIDDVQISLMGHAKLVQPRITREGGDLFVTDQVRGGNIRIMADERAARDDSATDLFQRAAKLRDAELPKIAPTAVKPQTQPSPTPSHPAIKPTTHPAPKPKPPEIPVVFEADNIVTREADNGNVAVVLQGNVRLFQQRPTGEIIEMSADNAVLFTTLKSLKELQQTGGKKKQGREMIDAAYLDTDVRIDYLSNKKGVPEQRLTADRVYYEFATDRAILTDAVIHTIHPQLGTPIVARAKLIRQLSNGEYAMEGAQVTNSQFALPSYAIASEKLYMRVEPTGDPEIGDRIIYDAYNDTFQSFGVPFFFMPHNAGEMTEHGFPLRAVGGGHDSDFGTFAETAWGLFESMGKVPPRDLDVVYRLDYFSARGPAFGLNAAYGGGAVTDTTKQPTDFEGVFKSYFVYDKGSDDVGRVPVRVDENPSLRGQVLWEHQHFFPDGWEVQARLGFVSDATFMEQWFRDDFENGDRRNFMGYIKHQQDSEAFTFGAVYQPNRLVTTSENQQEQFEVERLPEAGYYREGEALFNDKATLYSENTGEGLHFARSRDGLLVQGFYPGYDPGIPAEGYTGLTGQVIWRGDMREQLDYPFAMGPFKVDPYILGRYTEYSNSPVGGSQARLLAGAGTRISTQIWKTDPAAEYDFFDIHQLRHVIQPEMNFFTSAMNVQRNDVFVYDQEVDAINDISAGQFAIHQRWETKRGGPGDWRSVDVFTLNLEVDAFVNKPAKIYNNYPTFRGLYFQSYPEESFPRDAVNADASWRFSDNTVLLGDFSYNLDRGSVQTMALGVLVRRDIKLSYFLGNRYVADLNSDITSINVNYQLATKYILSLDQEFDFTQGKNVYSSAAIVREFDTFYMAFRYYFDETTKQNGVSFNLYPMGLGAGLDTNSFNTFHK
jgi:lipopolysaccharide export system protein LptA